MAGAVLIAAIGFAGSYAAVRELAEKKGFGEFSLVFPIGIDAGICVLLALDLLLTWLRIPFPLLRQTAWLLTAATIAFNGAAAWPDPLGVGMHAVIPVLFVVAVEAARHAVGRIADITADKHMEGVRLTRWLLSPVPTFRLWRRMKLWELRSYDQVIKLEQDRLIYQARLQARFGRNWRRKSPVEALMPLRLAKYGVPLAETAPAGLAAAGIEPALLPPAPIPAPAPEPAPAQVTSGEPQPELPSAPAPQHEQDDRPVTLDGAKGGHRGTAGSPDTPVFADSRTPDDTHEEVRGPGPGSARADERLIDAYRAWASTFAFEPTRRQLALWLQEQYGIATAAGDPLSDEQLQPLLQVLKQRGAPRPGDGPSTPPEETPTEDTWDHYFYTAWLACAEEQGVHPDAAVLAEYVYRRDGILGATGQPVTADDLRPYVALFRERQAVAGPAPAPQPTAADQTVETAPDHEGEENHDEVLPPGSSGEPGEQPGTRAGRQDQARAAERRPVHASGGESGGRSVVQVRVPKARDEDEPDAGEPAPESRESEGEQGTGREDGFHLTGPARVEFHYRQLPPEEQARSAKALAPALAELCGYREGTVRKYLGQIKRTTGM
ncbi:DUF2637 domain-containing protein [Streptomyces sp. ML-6]|uniref:DUF2637 domain-containing protein n=1 Tax=Streptomyces sp. ML-6 TaxID=2982693 RepID=UPI0024BF7729|nr:DUF2637 domain-containing protein [Streptomyces sp. ML-6]MDK0524827.1 DUF2637 domain-containing protein [Streptomyces sp. ML-6]